MTPSILEYTRFWSINDVLITTFRFNKTSSTTKMPPTRRIAYTAKDKMEMANMAETEGNRAAARHFGVNESNIRRWRKSLPSLQKQKKTQKALMTHSPGFPDLERLLLAGILERRQAGHAVSTTELRMRAVQVARNEFQIPESSFKASYGWAIKFMNRHGLSIRRRTTIAQRLPDAYEDQIQLVPAILYQAKIEE